mmetsp:Transcript_10016/g.24758  ORF Transcript_10016/g.24758 Transcript_10016/m.24758 type:complete len:435 (+) Transcript_10016:57-1361(+)
MGSARGGSAPGGKNGLAPWRQLLLVAAALEGLGGAAGFAALRPMGLVARGAGSGLPLQRGGAAERLGRKRAGPMGLQAVAGPKRQRAPLGEWLNKKAVAEVVVEEVRASLLGETEFGSFAVTTKEGRGKGSQVGGLKNQDSTFAGMLSDSMGLFGVFDGHGEFGGEVSRYVAQNLPLKFAMIEDQLRQAKGNERRVYEVLNEIFSECHQEMIRKESGIECFISGSTGLAVAAIKDGNEWRLIVSNAGDCRCVLAQSGWGGGVQATQLSNDQTPDRLDERKRIEGLGGVIGMVDDTVDPPQIIGVEDAVKKGVDLGPARVFWYEGAWEEPFNRFFPGLAMARSFGDHCLDELGVVPVPEITLHTVKPRDRFFVIASDGVWQVMSNEEVALCIAGQPDAATASEQLVKTAAKRWDAQGAYRDDITCVVVAFKNAKK